MIGAIIGDIVGSRFEFVDELYRNKNFTLFVPDCCPTDDSFMTLAIARALILAKGKKEYLGQFAVECMRGVGHNHPNTGWGGQFYRWLFEEPVPRPYNSFGNGAGMRVSPVAWVAKSEDEVKELSKIVTEVTHNHPEGLKGAEAIAMAVYLARTGKDKDYIKKRMTSYYKQIGDDNFTIEKIHGNYGYDEAGNWVTCQGSVPHAIVAFLDSVSFEDAIRNAVCIGGDSDTIGAMAGSIAEAYYGVPPEMEEKAISYLTSDLKGIYYAFNGIREKRTER